MQSNTELLLEALLSIRETPVEDRDNNGICGLVSTYIYNKCIEEYGEESADEVDHIDDEVQEAFSDLFEEWPEYSGCNGFPISGLNGSPTDTYFRLNKWSGSYGGARIRLLDWLIQRLQHG